MQSSLRVARVVRLAGAAVSRLRQAALALLFMVAPALLVSSASLASPEYVTWGCIEGGVMWQLSATTLGA